MLLAKQHTELQLPIPPKALAYPADFAWQRNLDAITLLSSTLFVTLFQGGSRRPVAPHPWPLADCAGRPIGRPALPEDQGLLG